MRIVLSLLADYALAHPDGKLYVTGGGIQSLPFPSFPATQPRLALALGFEVPLDEMGRPHLMRIEATGPTTDPIAKSVALTFTIPPTGAEGGDTGYFHFVSSMENVAFRIEGVYSFVVVVDGETLAQVDLRVIQRANEQLSGEMEATRLLVDGYEAFVGGNADLAEGMFRDVVTRFPELSHGHNNLGFVLLARGDANGAIEAFSKARVLGYVQTELSDANVGCALYLLKDWAGALKMFDQCVRFQVFRGQATLFGIDPQGLFPVWLASASDYLALMTLNAAWSARAAGTSTQATHYLALLRMAELSERDDASRGRFAESVLALQVSAVQDPTP